MNEGGGEIARAIVPLNVWVEADTHYGNDIPRDGYAENNGVYS